MDSKENEKIDFNAFEIEDLSKQLACPTGELGIQTGHLMHRTNFSMTKTTIDLLSLSENDSVVEIGHGNGNHMPYLMSRVKNLNYRGFEISKTMNEEARRINSEWIERKHAEFILYNGRTFPLEDSTVDKIYSVNNLYFWEQPEKFMKELARILIPAGQLNVAFGDKAIMDKLPFTDDNFQLYDEKEFKCIVPDNLALDDIIRKSEWVESKTGGQVLRKYSVAILFRKN